MNISVVIPVYNTAAYLERCLDSVFGQEFDGTLEVIAVDDASTDDSLAVLREYAAREPRLKVISLEKRERISVVRSKGLQVAVGDYIMQLDSDDWYLPGTLATMFSEITGSGADVAVFNLFCTDDTGKRQYPRNAIMERLLTGDKAALQPFFRGAAVCKIIRRELIRDMFFYRIEIDNGDDFLFLTEILLRAGKMLLIPNYFYAYYRNPGSYTRSIDHTTGLQALSSLADTTSLMLSQYDKCEELNALIYGDLLNKYLYMCSTKTAKHNNADLEEIKKIKSNLDFFPAETKKDVNIEKAYMNTCYFASLMLSGHINIKDGLRRIKWLVSSPRTRQ